MATGRGDADGVGVPVSVPGLCTDTWRQHSGVAFVGVGAGDVFGLVDRHSMT